MTKNRVLSLAEVLALPEGAWVWIEHAKGYGESHMPETAFSKLYRVWSLPQPPTHDELAENPWPSVTE